MLSFILFKNIEFFLGKIYGLLWFFLTRKMLWIILFVLEIQFLDASDFGRLNLNIILPQNLLDTIVKENIEIESDYMEPDEEITLTNENNESVVVILENSINQEGSGSGIQQNH